MKRLFILILMAFASINMMAQSAKVKDIRQTYLWDVTLSMQGKGPGAINIWDDVKEAMINDISQITDERTEIVVIPFQHKELETWKEMATPQGKTRLIERIRSYKIPLFDFGGKMTTMTNLYVPLQYVVDHVLSPDKVDILKLMTDGVSDMDQDKYEELLRHWCEIAKEKDAYGFYIMLTGAAKAGLSILQMIDPCRFEPVDVSQMNGATVSILILTPPRTITFNVRDDYGKDLNLKLTPSGSGELPPGYKVHVYSYENPYVKVDQVLTVTDDYTLKVKTAYQMSKEEMISTLPTDVNQSVPLKVEPATDMDRMPYATTQVLDDETSCEIINKPEKTVRFHVVQK